MKNSIKSVFLRILGILSMSIFLQAANPIYFYDMAGKLISNNVNYTEITDKNNPELYTAYQDLKNKHPHPKYTKICTIPGNNIWGTLIDTNINEDYIVCPCNKASFNPLDEICIDILNFPETLSILINSQQIKDKKLPIFDKNENSFDICNIPCFKDFLEWVHQIIKKYPTINFDNISWVISKNDWAMSYTSFPHKITMHCPLSSILKGMNFKDEGFLLHEMGHVDNHKKFPMLWNIHSIASKINPKLFTALLATTSLHMVSKLGTMITNKSMNNDPFNKYLSISKSIISAASLALLAAHTTHMTVGNIDERMADNYACKHGDKQALLGLKKNFEDTLNKEQEKIDDISDKLPYGFKTLGNYLLSGLAKILFLIADTHPLKKSRIAEIENALLNK